MEYGDGWKKKSLNNMNKILMMNTNKSSPWILSPDDSKLLKEIGLLTKYFYWALLNKDHPPSTPSILSAQSWGRWKPADSRSHLPYSLDILKSNII